MCQRRLTLSTRNIVHATIERRLRDKSIVEISFWRKVKRRFSQIVHLSPFCWFSSSRFLHVVKTRERFVQVQCLDSMRRVRTVRWSKIIDFKKFIHIVCIITRRFGIHADVLQRALPFAAWKFWIYFLTRARFKRLRCLKWSTRGNDDI